MTPDRAVPADTWQALADLLEAGRWSEAVDRLRRLAEETECNTVRLTLGALLAEREQFFEAITLWTQVIDAAGQTGCRDDLAAAHQNLAAVYRELGDYALAQRFQQRALQYQDDFGAEDLLHLANDALANSNWRLAESLLQSASELCTEDDPLQADLTATAGVARALQGDLASAIELLKMAYRQHAATGAANSAGRDLLNLAAVFRRQRRLKLEHSTLSRAARQFEAAGLPRRSAQSRHRQLQASRLQALQQGDPQAN